MVKTKMFTDLVNDIDPSVQINRWLDKHPDYIVVDIKLQSNVVDDVNSYWVFRDALVIYKEYENQKENRNAGKSANH